MAEETKGGKDKDKQKEFVYIEHCVDCEGHQWCTFHKSDEYKQYLEEVRLEVKRQIPNVVIIDNALPQEILNNPDGGTEELIEVYDAYRKKYSSQVVSEDGNLARFPRLGAFEVYYKHKTVFSKLRSRVWPHPEVIAKKLRIMIDNIRAGRKSTEGLALDGPAKKKERDVTKSKLYSYLRDPPGSLKEKTRIDELEERKRAGTGDGKKRDYVQNIYITSNPADYPESEEEPPAAKEREEEDEYEEDFEGGEKGKQLKSPTSAGEIPLEEEVVPDQEEEEEDNYEEEGFEEDEQQQRRKSAGGAHSGTRLEGRPPQPPEENKQRKGSVQGRDVAGPGKDKFVDRVPSRTSVGPGGNVERTLMARRERKHIVQVIAEKRDAALNKSQKPPEKPRSYLGLGRTNAAVSNSLYNTQTSKGLASGGFSGTPSAAASGYHSVNTSANRVSRTAAGGKRPALSGITSNTSRPRYTAEGRSRQEEKKRVSPQKPPKEKKKKGEEQEQEVVITKTYELSVPAGRVNNKKISYQNKEAEACEFTLKSSHPEEMMLKQTQLEVPGSEKAKFGLRFARVDEQTTKQFVLFIAKDGKPHENILLRVTFEEKGE